MPTYCYTTGDGQTHERIYPMGRCPKRIRVDGKVAHRDLVAEHGGIPSGQHGYPYWSDTLFAIPSTQEAWREHYNRNGVKDVEYNAGGQLKINSRSHLKALMKAAHLNEANTYL